MDSKFLRSSPCRAGSERLSSVSARNVLGPSPTGICSRNDGCSTGGERRRICGDARGPVCGLLEASELCNLTAGQVIRPLEESGADSWALLLAHQEELKTSKSGEVRRKRLAGQSSFERKRQSIDEIHSWENGSDTPLEPISGKVRSSFRHMGQGRRCKRHHNSSLLGSSRRSVVRCALANPIVDANAKARQMAQRVKRTEVRKARSVAQGDLDAVGRHCENMGNW